MTKLRILILTAVASLVALLVGCEVNGTHPLRVAIESGYTDAILYMAPDGIFGDVGAENLILLDGDAYSYAPADTGSISDTQEMYLLASGSFRVTGGLSVTDIRIDGGGGYTTVEQDTGTYPLAFQGFSSVVLSLETAFPSPGMSETFDLVVESDAPDPELRVTITVSRE